MKLLALGDVVSAAGCEFVRKKLPEIKREHGIDVCIANAENSAVGNGTLPFSADHLFSSGVDFLTGGNHSFRRKEILPYMESRGDIIRPYNMHPSNPGKGTGIIDMGRYRIGVINLIGNSFSNTAYANVFDSLDRAIAELADCRIKVVDFHAEATGEKGALAYYADGRVSALFGTHTHVQTADASVLPSGTGFISDLGMCGVKNSVLGVEPENVINMLRTGMPTRFKAAEGDCMINGCIFEIDEKTGLTLNAETIRIDER